MTGPVFPASPLWDVIIIGGGICGCSLLYELSRYRIDALLLEKENDVAVGTTKANSGIVHAGYDPKPDTAMAKYNVCGNRLIEQLCGDLDILYKKTGSLVIGFNDQDRHTIENLADRGTQNGVSGLRIIEGNELFALEPALSRDVQCALYAPSAAVVSPWELAFAQAECAVGAGAEVLLSAGVTGIKKFEDAFEVTTTKGVFKSRFVVNAAGVDSDVVSSFVEPACFSVTPKRGQYYLLDTTEGNLVKHVIFQCPSAAGKGILVAPTAHGNLIVGPNSETAGRGDLATTTDAMEQVKEGALRSVPGINFRASIRNFAGIRADAGEDFIVGESNTVPRFFNIAGIKSPGLSSAPAIAKDVAHMLLQKGLDAAPNPAFIAKRKIKRFKYMSTAERAEALRENPFYGTIVCRCETVTEGEIIDALNRPLPPTSLDAMKRRVTAGMGRCQSGFCGPRVLSLIAKHRNCAPEEVPLEGDGSFIVTGRTKGKRGAVCV